MSRASFVEPTEEIQAAATTIQSKVRERRVHAELMAQEEAAKSIQRAFRKSQANIISFDICYPDATPKKRPSFGRAAAERKLQGAAGRTPSAAIASAPASRSSTPASERPSVGWRGVMADFGSRSPSSPQSLPRPTSAPPSSARKVAETEPALPKSKGVRDVSCYSDTTYS